MFFCLTLINLKAQDIHLSEFWANPLYLNPAQTGVFDGDYRVAAAYRNQWRTIPVPYSTLSFCGDTKFNQVFSQNSSVGVGLIFNNDVSGDSRYSINQAYVPLSYIQKFKGDTNLTVSIGLSPGVSNIAFNTRKLSYDSQFDGDAYNPSLPTGENYPTQSKTYFDLGSGLAIQYKLKKLGYISVGTSLSHINRPNVSFFKNAGINLYSKSNTYVSVKLPLNEVLFVHGDFMYEKQGPFHETILAGRLAYVMSKEDNISLNFGLSARWNDAAIFLLGMDYKNYRVGLAYDVNTSAFNVATNKRGAIEVSLLCIFKKKPTFVPKKRSCPIYM
ncbi:MAG TPA: PorP/SprF family type IX secretion system membrane protein [Bacteroidia bacterium]|nr:PorP/SprF family type IX secretion system membrane protein [Bacteroidia bacterium]